MDYYITTKIEEEAREQPKIEQIAGPFRTVTQLIEALDMLLSHYETKHASKRYVWWIQETAVQHNLILEELPPDRARW